MTTSEQTDMLWPAFIKAKGDVTLAKRDSDNTDDGFRYASLTAVRQAVRYAMERHHLTELQRPVYVAASNVVTIHMRLLHESGQWVDVESLVMPVAVPYDARAVGEAITYARKYQLATVFGVTTDAGDVDMTHKEIATEIMAEAVASELAKYGRGGLPDGFDAMSPAQQLVFLRGAKEVLL